MIGHPTSVELTAHLAHWAEDYPARTAWLLGCLQRHNASDWGDLDLANALADALADDHALDSREGPRRSCYPVPDELIDSAECDDAVWVITDDLADSDPLTTILWPSDC